MFQLFQLQFEQVLEDFGPEQRTKSKCERPHSHGLGLLPGAAKVEGAMVADLRRTALGEALQGVSDASGELKFNNECKTNKFIIINTAKIKPKFF